MQVRRVGESRSEEQQTKGRRDRVAPAAEEWTSGARGSEQDQAQGDESETRASGTAMNDRVETGPVITAVLGCERAGRRCVAAGRRVRHPGVIRSRGRAAGQRVHAQHAGRQDGDERGFQPEDPGAGIALRSGPGGHRPSVGRCGADGLACRPGSVPAVMELYGR